VDVAVFVEKNRRKGLGLPHLCRATPPGGAKNQKKSPGNNTEGLRKGTSKKKLKFYLESKCFPRRAREQMLRRSFIEGEGNLGGLGVSFGTRG